MTTAQMLRNRKRKQKARNRLTTAAKQAKKLAKQRATAAGAGSTDRAPGAVSEATQ